MITIFADEASENLDSDEEDDGDDDCDYDGDGKDEGGDVGGIMETHLTLIATIKSHILSGCMMTY